MINEFFLREFTETPYSFIFEKNPLEKTVKIR